AKIRPIHGNDHVKRLEISLRDLPRLALDAIATPPARFGHARIRRLAGVITNRPRRIDLDAAIKATLAGLGPKDTLGRRRAADVAHANKQDTNSCHGVSPSAKLSSENGW